MPIRMHKLVGRPMPEFEKQFEAFLLSPQKTDEFAALGRYEFSFCPPPAQLVVETVLVENGDRKVVRSEALGAKLV